MSYQLPQVHASDAELAATDALHQSARMRDYADQHHQQQYQLQPYTHTQQYQQNGQLPAINHSPSSSSRPATAAAASSSSRPQTASTFAQTGRASLGHTYTARPTTSHTYSRSAGPGEIRASVHSSSNIGGIRPVPKEQQPLWQSVLQQGPNEYMGSTYHHALTQHLPTPLMTGYADGPQHLEDAEHLATLPDAPHRQAWANQPTFRWHKRYSYEDVPDRLGQRGGFTGRGDNLYRPLSVLEQEAVNERMRRRVQNKGTPRTGEW